jgi:hypothetical protein
MSNADFERAAGGNRQILSELICLRCHGSARGPSGAGLPCAPTNSAALAVRRGEASRAFEGRLWVRRDQIPQEFVTLPGETYPNSALADACYTLSLAPKSAARRGGGVKRDTRGARVYQVAHIAKFIPH